VDAHPRDLRKTVLKDGEELDFVLPDAPDAALFDPVQSADMPAIPARFCVPASRR
jgi:hypothetical protein